MLGIVLLTAQQVRLSAVLHFTQSVGATLSFLLPVSLNLLLISTITPPSVSACFVRMRPNASSGWAHCSHLDLILIYKFRELTFLVSSGRAQTIHFPIYLLHQYAMALFLSPLTQPNFMGLSCDLAFHISYITLSMFSFTLSLISLLFMAKEQCSLSLASPQ